MSDLRNKLIRLAHAKPELRKHLLPILKEANTRMPRNADEWQLYAHRSGAEEAAKSLTAAVKKAIAEFNTWAKKNKHLDEDLGGWDSAKKKKAKKTINSKLDDLFDKIVDPVMTKYDQLGASDTQPYNIANDLLYDAAEAAFQNRMANLVKEGARRITDIEDAKERIYEKAIELVKKRRFKFRDVYDGHRALNELIKYMKKVTGDFKGQFRITDNDWRDIKDYLKAFFEDQYNGVETLFFDGKRPGGDDGTDETGYSTRGFGREIYG